jgi:hypothetical protein
MASGDLDFAELLGRRADERLLERSCELRPAELGEPPAEGAESPARPPLIAAGAALTGMTLIGGTALVIFGVVELAGAGLGLAWPIAVVLGAVLIATHWGWVHVAEVSAGALDRRYGAAARAAREAWLAAIEPYTRHEVVTRVLEDGTLELERAAYRPVALDDQRFTFAREVELRELHDPDEPAAALAERAELMRRAAALDTERQRRRYELAADAYRAALLARDDEQQRLLARRAAAQALSEAINRNLGEPPLLE